MENKKPNQKSWDILCTGELLVDCISESFADAIDDQQSFRMIPGGSPGNLCMNMARLGNRCLLSASIGQDDMGQLLWNTLTELGVATELVARRPQPTTLILVTRSKNVANFEAYRSADREIQAAQFPRHILQDIRLFHTTCFALSLEPARRNILEAAAQAKHAGTQLSIDLNYAAKLWPDRQEAQKLVADYCAQEALVKISEVDWERLYESPLEEPQVAAQHFLDLGAKLVCVTLGGEGCLVADATSSEFLAAREVEVLDTTGAGDALWSGFLTAWLEGNNPLDCARSGRKMAELKLGYFGPLPTEVDRELVLSGM